MPAIQAHRRSLAPPPVLSPPLLNLVGWYKSDTGVYKDAGSTLAINGDTVQQWNDQSGLGHHLLQATSGRRPLFNTNQVNGLPGLTFDGVDDYLNASWTMSLPVQIFIVLKEIAWTDTKVLVGAGFGDRMNLLQDTTTPRLSLYNGSTLGCNNSDLPVSTWGIVQFALKSAAANYIAINNLTHRTGGSSGATANPDGINIGSHPNPSNYANIQAAEILVYDTAWLSGADETLALTYLNSRAAAF